VEVVVENGDIAGDGCSKARFSRLFENVTEARIFLHLHQSWVLTFHDLRLVWLTSTVERVSNNKT
jgi:hypothetical protein